MEELLLKWERLEPDRCRFVRGLSAQVMLSGTACNIYAAGYEGDSHAIVQAAAQQCIEKKGWTWLLGTDFREKGFTAHVWNAPGGEPNRRWIGTNTNKVSPAIALLSAYLQALEAHR